MKKIFLALTFVAISMTLAAQTNKTIYERDNNKIKEVSVFDSTSCLKTNLTFTDKYGNDYPLYCYEITKGKNKGQKRACIIKTKKDGTRYWKTIKDIEIREEDIKR